MAFAVPDGRAMMHHVLELLRRPDVLCEECLAAQLDVSVTALRSSLLVLSRTVPVERTESVCTGCGRRTTVVIARLQTQERDAVVVDTVRAAGLPGACESCVAEALGRDVHDVRQAAARLRMAGQLGVTAGPCARCGHPRLLLVAASRAA